MNDLLPLIIPSGIALVLIVILIRIVMIKKAAGISKGIIVGLILIAIFNSLFLADLLIWFGSSTNIYALPTYKGTMHDITITEKPGGTSSFYISDKRFKIANSYNDILEENKNYTVTITPITHYVCKIDKLD